PRAEGVPLQGRHRLAVAADARHPRRAADPAGRAHARGRRQDSCRGRTPRGRHRTPARSCAEPAATFQPGQRGRAANRDLGGKGREARRAHPRGRVRRRGGSRGRSGRDPGADAAAASPGVRPGRGRTLFAAICALVSRKGSIRAAPMTATPDAVQGAVPGALAGRRGLADALAVYVKRRVLIVLFLGFSAGLPLALSGSTLLVWMREAGVDLGTIGLFALVGTPYTIKFLWAPIVDALDVPLLSSLFGR